jgi:hypothetical protein
MTVSIGEGYSDNRNACFTIETPDLEYNGFMGLTAANLSPMNTILNHIDILKVSVQNTIEANYKGQKSTKEKYVQLKGTVRDNVALKTADILKQ